MEQSKIIDTLETYQSPSGRMPEKAPRWDLTGTEGCGGGKVVSWLPWMFLGIYKPSSIMKNSH